jgi:hypothetical protein
MLDVGLAGRSRRILGRLVAYEVSFQRPHASLAFRLWNGICGRGIAASSASALLIVCTDSLYDPCALGGDVSNLRHRQFKCIDVAP